MKHLIDKNFYFLYNTPIYKCMGVEMENKYGFLFKKSSLPKSHLNNLLQIEDFVKAADNVIANGKGIEDSDIYNIATSIYFPMLYDHQTEGFKEVYKAENGSAKYKEWSFKYRVIGQAVKSFSKVLYGNAERWKEDYAQFSH